MSAETAPAACRVCHQYHSQADPFWTCADHGHAYTYVTEVQGQEFWGCPVKGCVRGRWIT